MTVQAVGVLTQAAAGNMPACLATMGFGTLYYVYAGIVDDMLHMRRHARLSSRLQRQTGEAFSDYPPATGTVPGFDESFRCSISGEKHIVLLMTCQGCWTLRVMATHQQVVRLTIRRCGHS